MATLNADIRNKRKEMKAEGYSKVEIDYALFLRKKSDDPERIAEERAARERVSKWLAMPEGYQGGLFDGVGDGVNRMPAEDRASEEGKTAGLSGKPCSPPYDASTPQGQAWIKSWHAGQAVLLAGFKTPKTFEDDAESGKPSIRSRGNPASGMPSARPPIGDDASEGDDVASDEDDDAAGEVDEPPVESAMH
jgi:hypothetical protein